MELGRRLFQQEAVTARDGVELGADVYLPPLQSAPARGPVILITTPYGRRRPAMMKLARALTGRGFAVALLDSRGRHRSGGEFLSSEEQDGQDTLLWLRAQPWCDGRVGLLGISLSAFQAFLLASAPAPAGIEIRALVNLMGAVDLHSAFYHQGALVMHWAIPWLIMMSGQWMNRAGGWQSLLPWPELFRHLPLDDIARRAASETALWREFVGRSRYDEGWRRFDVRERLARIEAPVLHLSGWYDNALEQVLQAYRRLGQRVPARQSLVVGPWDHQTIFVSLLGSASERSALGAKAPLDLSAVLTGWLERCFGGAEKEGEGEAEAGQELERADEDGGKAGEEETRTAGADSLARGEGACFYLMGEDSWLASESFPPAGVEVEDWFLDGGGPEDGRLVAGSAGAAGERGFSYDPEDPVPTAGGVLWPFSSQGLDPGPADQSGVERRGDVLVYTSAPLAGELAIAGPVEAEVWAATSAPDTDFTAKLVDVDRAGSPWMVLDGIVRCRHREGAGGERLVAPGSVLRLAIPLGSIAHCFGAGHRLRLEVSSSNFPKYDRNLNTGGPLHTDRALAVARQTVFHGGDRPSRLRLTVMPEAVRARCRRRRESRELAGATGWR
jgi:predicted acyl esterase